MSDPVDARVLRWMVRETASESASPVDWDAAEDKLLARLDAPPSVLGSALEKARLEGPDANATADEDDELAGIPLIAAESSHSATIGSAGSADDAGDEDTDVRLSLPVALPSVPFAASAVASIHTPGGTPHTIFLQGDVGDDESVATDAYHSTSLIHDPPKNLEKARPSRARRARWATVASLAAVAACALFFTGGARLFGHAPGEDSRPTEATIQAEHWVDAADVPLAPGLDGVRDLNALHAGDVVEATDGAVSFGSKDRLTWTLAPGTRVLIRTGIESSSTRHVLVLENGSIRADVARADAPADARERAAADPSLVAAADAIGLFVVEAGDTQVATAGMQAGLGSYERTTFSVTRSSIGIVVDVEEGTTRVSARSDLHPSEARFLSAPHRASVSLDGAKDFRLLDAIRTAMLNLPSPSVDHASRTPDGTRDADRSNPRNADPIRNAPRADEPRLADRVDPIEAQKAPASDSQSDRTAKDGTAGAQAPTDDPALTEASILASLNACFATKQAKHKADDKEGTVSFSDRSTLTLGVDDQSTLRNAAFNPPLRPDLQACAVGLLHKKVEGGPRTITLPIEIAH